MSERSESDIKSLQSFVASEISSAEKTPKTTPIKLENSQNQESFKQMSSLTVYKELN